MMICDNCNKEIEIPVHRLDGSKWCYNCYFNKEDGE